MFMRKRKLVSLVYAVLSLILLLAVPVRAADVEASVEANIEDYVEDNVEEDDSGFYFDVGASLYVVHLPKWTPLWYTKINAGPTYTTSGRISVINEGFIAAPLFEATLGQELVDQWFMETKLEYAAIEVDKFQEEYGNGLNTGPTWCPFDGVGTNLRGAINNTDIHTTLRFRQYGASLVAGKTYGGDDWHIRPFAGYWFQETKMNYHLLWKVKISNVVAHFKEKLRTRYNGLLAGVEWTFPVGSWDIGLETTHGVALAHTRYAGSFKDPTAQNSLRLGKDNLAYRGTLQFTASTPVGNGWEFGLTSELRYLSYVPRIIASGQASNVYYADPTHLVGESSLSGKLGLELSCSF